MRTIVQQSANGTIVCIPGIRIPVCIPGRYQRLQLYYNLERFFRSIVLIRSSSRRYRYRYVYRYRVPGTGSISGTNNLNFSVQIVQTLPYKNCMMTRIQFVPGTWEPRAILWRTIPLPVYNFVPVFGTTGWPR